MLEETSRWQHHGLGRNRDVAPGGQHHELPLGGIGELDGDGVADGGGGPGDEGWAGLEPGQAGAGALDRRAIRIEQDGAKACEFPGFRRPGRDESIASWTTLVGHGGDQAFGDLSCDPRTA